MTLVTITVPIRIESTPNLREHHHARAKRAREHRASAFYCLKSAKAPHALPCVVTLTRVAPRSLDTDNLVSGLKAARDGVADYLLILEGSKKVDDSDPRITWRYAQIKGDPKEYAARICIESDGVET